MAICVDIFRALVNSGATPEMMLAVVEAQAAADERAAAERRRKDRERQRTYRESHRVTVTPRDTCDKPQEIVAQPEPWPQDAVPAIEPEITVSPEKEKSPTPPKENTTTTNTSSEDLFEEPSSSVNTRARRKSNATATRLPGDWQPSLEDLAYARKVGLTEIQITNQIEEFRDYWHARAGPDALKVSWPATWRRWCRKHLTDYAENGHGQHRNGSFKGDTAGDSFAVLATKAAQRARGFGEI